MGTEVKRVVRDGMVAVLVSPGYGAGWSTWAGEYKEWAMFSPEVVEWVEGGKVADIRDVVEGALGSDNRFYTGGADELEVEWVPQGTQFYIDEYDGSESLEIGFSRYTTA